MGLDVVGLGVRDQAERAAKKHVDTRACAGAMAGGRPGACVVKASRKVPVWIAMAVTALVITAALPLPVGAESGLAGAKFKFSGSSTFKAYYTSTLRVANSTNLSLDGDILGWRFGLSTVLSGRNYGIPSNAIVIGPWGEFVEKWSARAVRGATAIQLGDTSIPVLSSQLLAGRSLYGAMATTGARLGPQSSATATGFYGINAVSSGLGASSHRVWGGAVDLGLGRNFGMSLGYLDAERENVDLSLGSGQAWMSLGRLRLSGEVAFSEDHITDARGESIVVGAYAPMLGGRVSASALYTSPDFKSLNSLAAGKEGGIGEISGGWSGALIRPRGVGPSADAGVAVKYATDNIDGSLAHTTGRAVVDTTLTLRRLLVPLIQLKYAFSAEQSDDLPDPTTSLKSQAMSVDVAAPLKLGDLSIDLSGRASRTESLNEVTGGGSTIDIVALAGATMLGQTAVRFTASHNQVLSKLDGVRKTGLEASVSLGSPIIKSRLSGALDLKFTDSRSYDPGSGDTASQSDGLDVTLGLNYIPRAGIDTKLRYKQNWVFADGDLSEPSLDHWIEGELTYRF
ncbi:MAG: hypothetical protein NUW23_00015 [Firmicutes bacterium]|jgi:hypothetical protein|nr:hypothetical protein [Bacillota bacterium]